jgi:hypothetical protein
MEIVHRRAVQSQKAWMFQVAISVSMFKVRLKDRNALKKDKLSARKEPF